MLTMLSMLHSQPAAEYDVAADIVQQDPDYDNPGDLTNPRIVASGVGLWIHYRTILWTETSIVGAVRVLTPLSLGLRGRPSRRAC